MDHVFTYQLGDSLYINLTNRCTNDCDFCVRHQPNGIGDYDLWLTREPEAAEVIALIPDPTQYRQIVFCGYGEPMIRLDALKEIAAYVKEKGGQVRINTNGQANLIHGRDVTGELAGLVDEMNISLNASDAEKYQAMCHSEFGEAAFEGLLDFAARAAKVVPKVVLSVVDVIGEEEIARCRKAAERIGVPLRVRAMIR